MELLQLRYFKEAAECGNFSKVAKKNMVSQPSISQAIRKLEKELGVELFVRNGKKIKLSRSGAYLYKKVNIALNSLDEAVTYLSAPKLNEISIYTQAGETFLSLLNAEFSLSFHTTFLNFISANDVISSSYIPYAFTFMHLSEDMHSYNYELLLEDELVALVSNDSDYAQYDSLSIKHLKNSYFSSYYRSISARENMEHFCKKYGNFTPTVIFETHDYSAVLHIVSKMNAVTILPRKFYEIAPLSDLKVIELKEKQTIPLFIAWSKDRILSAHEKQFLRYAKIWFDNL